MCGCSFCQLLPSPLLQPTYTSAKDKPSVKQSANLRLPSYRKPMLSIVTGYYVIYATQKRKYTGNDLPKNVFKASMITSGNLVSV